MPFAQRVNKTIYTGIPAQYPGSLPDPLRPGSSEPFKEVISRDPGSDIPHLDSAGIMWLSGYFNMFSVWIRG